MIFLSEKEPAMKSIAHTLACLIIATVRANVVVAAIPQTTSYWDVLADALGQPVADGTYSLTFKLYTALNGGDPIWTSTKNV
jgi:hypothetical protein